ncbi:protein-L-isoaspartate O-methyltransferase family protein [Stakelama saccharophila]|uniref:Protein-L-isoaspartate O-methyltransferase n=1 Tax=Stakelama saccharophila TaxID=3075605 RepID=A0ABZ0B6I0_9SPHN|nr:protein-L-isoaspartate O-methyltransferase [Stakelama sp. W311]WNO52994.1 protein-L-isoaspartate O-methyltransferase [Stakelama sp. W311]
MNNQADLSRFEKMRRAMVASQLRTNAVDDARVVQAMAVVPRERYLPDGVREIAYRDTLLPLGRGRHQNLPMATGRLLTEARIGRDDSVLLIGAAGGYTAAVIALLAKSVTALEVDPDLVGLAREALADVKNVEVVEGPLCAGWAVGQPYDAIIVDGAVEDLPAEIVAQARVGAHIATGIVDRGVTRLAVGERTQGGFGLFDFADADCAILPGFDRPKRFTF